MSNQSRKNVIAPKHDSFFFHEMMVHPVLFTHPKPEKVAIIDNNPDIGAEVLKHLSIVEVCCVNNNHQLTTKTEDDKRIRYQSLDSLQWLGHEADTFDIIIRSEAPENFLEEDFDNYFRALKADGIFMQSYPISLLQINALKPVYHHLEQAGFNDWQLLHFPQPSYPTGWRVAIMASKSTLLKQISEKNIHNRSFKTRYYNFDMHKAALALPEFVREELY